MRKPQVMTLFGVKLVTGTTHSKPNTKETTMTEETTLTLRYDTLKVFYPNLTIEDWHAFVDEIGNFMEEYLQPYGEDGNA